MGIALFTISRLFTPLQALFSRLLLARWPAAYVHQGTARPATATATHRAGLRPPGTQPWYADAAQDISENNSVLIPHRTLPLRVVRRIESGIPSGSTGRMVISGRMADVCDELDRLAAMEATSQRLRP